MMLGRRRGTPVDVLVVCTGNLCRSPMMETVLRDALPGLTVSSAGTAGNDGAPWHPFAVEVLTEAGLAVSGAARRLRAKDVRAATLVLTAEGIHRGAVVDLDPTAEERCFTLLEAQRLLSLVPVEQALGAEALAEHLAAAMTANPLEHDDDLRDPIEGTIDDFRECLRRIRSAVDVIAPSVQLPARSS